MLTKAQVRWASQHDWFLGDEGDGTISVLDCYTLNGELLSTVVTWTGTFQALRAWAGY